jgi:hypothetical protein
LTGDGGLSWKQIKTNLKENIYALSLYDKKTGFAVGSGGTILRTIDGGETWQDQESSVKMNLYAVTAYSPTEAVAVGEFGAVLRTEDGGKTWEIQPNITSNSLQAIVYRGGADLWVGGRGGSILRRSETLSTVKLLNPKVPPILRSGNSKVKPKSREPLLTITDDDDIPLAEAPKK